MRVDKDSLRYMHLSFVKKVKDKQPWEELLFTIETLIRMFNCKKEKKKKIEKKKLGKNIYM